MWFPGLKLTELLIWEFILYKVNFSSIHCENPEDVKLLESNLKSSRYIKLLEIQPFANSTQQNFLNDIFRFGKFNHFSDSLITKEVKLAQVSD